MVPMSSPPASRMIEIYQQDTRQVENLENWKLGENGITTDRIWITSIGECAHMSSHWISHIFVEVG